MQCVIPEFLYHGSAVGFSRIDVSKGRDRKDFGKGFYMAFSREQAIGMMNKKYEEAVGILGESIELKKTLYRIELSREVLPSLRVKEFPVADREWFDFILMCRATKGVPHDYDVVIGPTADDNTNFVLKNYMAGAFGDWMSAAAKRAALDALEPDTLGFQFYSGRQSVIDRIVRKFEPVDWRSL